MKKATIRALTCIATIVLALTLVLHTGHILDPAWSEDGFDVIEAFHKIEENTLDVIVYGSSRAWKGCDTRVMCDEYGLSAYNYGCNWQAMNTILLFLEDSFRTQTPEVVCIEVGLVGYIMQDVNMDGQIYYTKAIPQFDGKKEYLKQCFGNDIGRYISYFLPLTIFHENWNTINSENFRFPGPDRFLATRGYFPSATVNAYEIPDYSSMEQAEIPADCVDVLDKMVSLCKEKDVGIIFFTNPTASHYIYSDAMTQYAAQNQCAYIDFYKHLDDSGISGEIDFQDEGHLNESGSYKTASYLAKYIIENYGKIFET